MGCFRFSAKVISWFESYLWGRSFKFDIDKKFLDWGNITCGVPQGSILGPMLFLLYVTDMSQAMKCYLFLYADDAFLTFQQENGKETVPLQLYPYNSLTTVSLLLINWIWIYLASAISLSTTN